MKRVDGGQTLDLFRAWNPMVFPLKELEHKLQKNYHW